MICILFIFLFDVKVLDQSIISEAQKTEQDALFIFLARSALCYQ